MEPLHLSRLGATVTFTTAPVDVVTVPRAELVAASRTQREVLEILAALAGDPQRPDAARLARWAHAMGLHVAARLDALRAAP